MGGVRAWCSSQILHSSTDSCSCTRHSRTRCTKCACNARNRIQQLQSRLACQYTLQGKCCLARHGSTLSIELLQGIGWQTGCHRLQSSEELSWYVVDASWQHVAQPTSLTDHHCSKETTSYVLPYRLMWPKMQGRRMRTDMTCMTHTPHATA